MGTAAVLHHRRTWIIEELYAPELAQRPVLDRAVLLVVRGGVGGEERRPGDVAGASPGWADVYDEFVAEADAAS